MGLTFRRRLDIHHIIRTNLICLVQKSEAKWKRDQQGFIYSISMIN